MGIDVGPIKDRFKKQHIFKKQVYFVKNQISSPISHALAYQSPLGTDLVYCTTAKRKPSHGDWMITLIKFARWQWPEPCTQTASIQTSLCYYVQYKVCIRLSDVINGLIQPFPLAYGEKAILTQNNLLYYGRRYK